jgi:hypothetical protein
MFASAASAKRRAELAGRDASLALFQPQETLRKLI